MFCYMTVRTTNKSAKPKLEKKELRTKHQFLVVYMKAFPKFNNPTQPLKNCIKELVKSNFHNLTTDESTSIDSCFVSGSAFLILAFSADGKKPHGIGTILFSADPN